MLAYDKCPQMLAVLRRRLAGPVADRRVEVIEADERSFPNELRRCSVPQGVTANFAVLNLMLDLESFFATLATHLAAPGLLFLSVLNPLRKLLSRL